MKKVRVVVERLEVLFQVEDGIRDIGVTGVQTCALPICGPRFGVVLDRRRLGAPTAEGRTALEGWAADELPAHVPAIAAWADVFDERRYLSLTRNGEEEGHGPGYPQHTFADCDAAVAWVRAALAAG